MKAIFIILSLILTTNSYATKNLSLKDAREHGLVCENLDGLIVAVGHANHELLSLIKAVNTKRLLKYKEIATKDKTPLSQVQTAAGNKQIQNAPKGRFVMDARIGSCIEKK